MTTRCFAGLLLIAAGGALAWPASAEPAPAATVTNAGGNHVLKLTNAGKGGITAIYVAPAGSRDMSDDLLGKQTAGAGKTVVLKVSDPKGDCVFDLQFLMADSTMVTKKNVNLCQVSDLSFSP